MEKKHILCYGDSNTHGYDGERGGARFDDDVRWTMQLQKKLGDAFLVCEEGLNGRTTAFEDPILEGVNGLATLAPVFMTHAPLDLAVIMLGGNDCKQRFACTPRNSADGLLRLVKKARSLDVWRAEPRILIVAPLVAGKGFHGTALEEALGEGMVEKSARLAAFQKKLAAEQGCYFYDCNEVAVPNKVDFIHFDRESHGRFAEEMAKIVGKIFGQD